MCGMYIINGVHGPEPRSSGGNTSSNSQVSALIPRPAFNGMERMCERHGSNQNSQMMENECCKNSKLKYWFLLWPAMFENNATSHRNKISRLYWFPSFYSRYLYSHVSFYTGIKCNTAKAVKLVIFVILYGGVKNSSLFSFYMKYTGKCSITNRWVRTRKAYLHCWRLQVTSFRH